MLAVIEGAIRVAEAQRRFPYWIIWAMALVAVAWVIGTAVRVFPWQDTGNVPAVQPEQQANTAPVENPPAQIEPENVAPTTNPVAWPFVQVAWTPVTDLSILPPAEQGFYNGTMQNAPDGSVSTPELGAYAKRIIPEVKGHPVSQAVAAITRDQKNKDFVLVGFALAGPQGEPYSFLFFSADGEKTWKEINLTPGAFDGAIVLPWETRVTGQNGTIRLFVRAGGGGLGNWWTATAP